jgi:nucleoside 2-deoxyribosyltransferase
MAVTKLMPFADDAASVAIDKLTIENGMKQLSLCGSLDITRDKVGLQHALALEAIIAVQSLTSDPSLPKRLSPSDKPKTVSNPFASSNIHDDCLTGLCWPKPVQACWERFTVLVKAYLAGPDVFLPNARVQAKRKVAICAQYNVAGCPPLNEDIESLAALPDDEAWKVIFSKDLAMMAACDIIIANLTPFRGPSADAGTLVEVGWFLGRDRPVFGYSKIDKAQNIRHEYAGDGEGPGQPFASYQHRLHVPWTVSRRYAVSRSIVSPAVASTCSPAQVQVDLLFLCDESRYT